MQVCIVWLVVVEEQVVCFLIRKRLLAGLRCFYVLRGPDADVCVCDVLAEY
jgi:hypothetical protein